MARFYNPREGQERRPVDFGYDHGVDAGTSGDDVSDLNPAAGYNVDLRYGNEKDELYKSRADSPTTTPGSWPERPSYTKAGDILSQDMADKFIRSAKAAGKFKLAEYNRQFAPYGETPRNPRLTNASSFGPYFGAVETPSMGASGGRSGAVGYADKPKPRSGRAYNYLDAFS